MSTSTAGIVGTVDAEAIRAARGRVADTVHHTPVLTSRSVSAQVGGQVLFKAENLQRTGSFKLRGALNTVRSLPAPKRGVVAGSAGNHAQSLAYAARAARAPCRVFMPEGAALSKVAAAAALGADVILGGGSVDECVALAREDGERTGATLVHPFDDHRVIAGQGTLGLELLDDVPDLADIIVPLGGGGLAAGIAVAVKSARPEVRIWGVQVRACAPYPSSLAAGEAVATPARATIADGIAIKRPGMLTLPLIDRWLDGVVVVDDDAVAEAMVLLLERSKLVVEGAGAVGLAALLTGELTPSASGATVVVLSGGNVDAGLLSTIARRHETRAGRRTRLFCRIPDLPGGLSGLLTLVADSKANVLSVEHVRDGIALHVGETGVELVVETRGHSHATELLKGLERAGYTAEVQSHVEVPTNALTGALE